MERFLVIQTAFIGDAVLTLPMLQKLKELNPESLIDVIAIPRTSEIFRHSAAVNDVIIFDKRGKHRTIFQIYKFAKFLKQRKYARIYSPHRSLRTSLLVMLSGVRETYGFDNNSLNFVYKYLAEYKKGKHEVERNLHLIQFPTEMESWRILPEVSIPEKTEDKIDDILRESGKNKNFAAVAPGSVWNTKIYPAEYTEKVVRFLQSGFDMVFLIGGEQDKKVCEDLEKNLSGNVKSVAGRLNLIESISFLNKMKLLVSNDSAPSHLAMCANIPVLMIYCSTVPDFGFYPYNKKSYFLSFNDLFCKPCGIHGYNKCPVGNFACGYNLKPETVITKIEEMVNV